MKIEIKKMFVDAKEFVSDEVEKGKTKIAYKKDEMHDKKISKDLNKEMKKIIDEVLKERKKEAFKEGIKFEKERLEKKVNKYLKK